MPTTRTSDDASEEVSHAATPRWSGAMAARSAPMPCVALVWVSSGPDCQLEPLSEVA